MTSSNLTSNPSYTASIIGVGKAGDGADASKQSAGFRIGYTHAEMYQRHQQAQGRVRLVAGADINAENLAAWQRHFGVEGGFHDYQTMLQEVKPDILSICTYVGLHRPMIEAAANAGVKAILCEKPFVNSPADLAAVEAIAAQTGVKICVGHIRRYAPAYQRAAQLYGSGAVGELVLCSAGVDGWDLSEMASHHLDALRQFNGDSPLQWVFGQARVRDLRSFGHAMEEHIVTQFKFVNGGRGYVEAGEGFKGAEYSLMGTKGVIYVNGFDQVTVVNESGLHTEDLSRQRGAQWDELWDLHLEKAVAWLDGGPEAPLGLTTTARTAELNLAAYVSAIRGDRVDFPLQDELQEWPVEVLARRA